MSEITLKKPVEYNGETYKELSFDFDKLTGADAIAIEDELQALGKQALIPAYSSPYLIRMAVLACDKPIGDDFFNLVSISDFNIVKNAARSFLLGTA
ncbi:MAG: hypothetical protein ACI4F5_06520 [Acutalibacteraceae bacterium]